MLLWALRGSDRLGPQAHDLITSTPVVQVSAVTVWELTIKEMLGELAVGAGFADRLVDQGFRLLDVTAAHGEKLREFPELVRHDPFDRLIIAQAAAEGLQLLTADRVLLGLGRPFVVDAAR